MDEDKKDKQKDLKIKDKDVVEEEDPLDNEEVEEEPQTDDDDFEDEDNEPKHTFKADEKPDEQLGVADTEGKEPSNENEHSFDDLVDEGEHKKPMEESKIEPENQDEGRHIPHVSSLGSQFPSSGVYSSHNRYTKGNKLHVLILIVIGLAVIAATVYLLRGSFDFGGNLLSTPAPTQNPESTQAPVSTPAPSPSPTIERAEFKVRILNGTSTSGLAATVSEKLKPLGYKIERVGNATNSAFSQTQVRAKNPASGIIEQLIQDLSPDYSAASSSALKSNDPADVEIILGAK